MTSALYPETLGKFFSVFTSFNKFLTSLTSFNSLARNSNFKKMIYCSVLDLFSRILILIEICQSQLMRSMMFRNTV